MRLTRILSHKYLSLSAITTAIFFTVGLGNNPVLGQYVASTVRPEQSIPPKQEADKAKMSLQQALSMLTEKYNVQFGYKTELVQNLFTEDKTFINEASVEVALAKLLKPFDLRFKRINNKNYVIKGKREPTASGTLEQQPISPSTDPATVPPSARKDAEESASALSPANLGDIITGRVVDANGKGIPNVSVTIKGTNLGATTDNNGGFSVNVENEASVLVFSSVGFVSQEVKLEGNKILSVVMVSTNTALGEVVVVGYNTQRRKDLTGSVASVKSKDIVNLPAASLSTALQGRIPGAYISQVDGDPTSGASVVIRGPLSINGGDPLYVVDGVPFQGTGFNFNNQDIESIDVLKDASAAAVYGYRAAGGVILIRTKKGSSGKIKVGVNSSVGVRKVFNLPSTLRRDDYIAAKKAFGFNVVDLYGPENGWSALPNTNWFEEVYRPALEQNHTIFLSGGSEKSTFYMSGNFARIEGTRIGNVVNRYTFRVNSDHKLGKRVKLGQTLFSSFTKEDPNSATNQGELSYRNTPVMLVYDSTNPFGGWGKTPKGFQGGNDVQSALGNYTRNENYEVLLTVNLDVEIMKGLVFKTVAGTSLAGSNNFYNNFLADVGIGQVIPDFGKSMSKAQSFILTYTLNYNKTFGVHAISALAGYEARRSNFSDLTGRNQNPLVPLPPSFDLVQTVTTATVSGRNVDVYDRVLSQFGRVEYSYDNKYLLTGTIRRDGVASKFGPNNRYGVFPGASVGWKLSEERFMRSIKDISSLKFRAGYGVLGNSVGGDFLYSAAFGTGFTADLGSGRRNSVNISNRLPNPDIRWESVATTNIGLDIGLFNEKLGINLDYYNRQTKDMIYNLGISPSSGLGGSVQANVGEMRNRGFEFNIDYRDKIGKEFNFSIGFNGAINKNELISLDPKLGKSSLTNGGLTEPSDYAETSRSEKGRELGNFYGYSVIGIYQTNATAPEKRPTINGGYIPVAGDLIYRDLNNDGVINADDRTYIGSPWPKLNYGINLRASWKGFDINAFLNGVSGISIYNGFETFQHTFFSDYTTGQGIFETSGFNGNGVTGKPRVGTLEDYDKNLNWSSVNSYHVQNAAYFRMRNLQIGYSLPAVMLNRMKLTSLRLFVMGDNLFTITKYKGPNPDLGSGSFLDRGIDNANQRYPVSRIFSFGINAEF
jgi:TonB-dependent starch-binding outer membrane protein SusC